MAGLRSVEIAGLGKLRAKLITSQIYLLKLHSNPTPNVTRTHLSEPAIPRTVLSGFTPCIGYFRKVHARGFYIGFLRGVDVTEVFNCRCRLRSLFLEMRLWLQR